MKIVILISALYKYYYYYYKFVRVLFLTCFLFIFFSSGEWKNGLKHGKGVEATKEGRYEGEWRDDMVIVNKNNKHYQSYYGD